MPHAAGAGVAVVSILVNLVCKCTTHCFLSGRHSAQLYILQPAVHVEGSQNDTRNGNSLAGSPFPGTSSQIYATRHKQHAHLQQNRTADTSASCHMRLHTIMMLCGCAAWWLQSVVSLALHPLKGKDLALLAVRLLHRCLLFPCKGIQQLLCFLCMAACCTHLL